MQRSVDRAMMNQYARTELLLGPEAMERLSRCRVAVFGLGGVGGYTVEALVRSGVGALDLIDSDRFCLSNLNRQLFATRKTLGKYKVDAAAERILDINPDCRVTAYKTFFLPETKDQFDFSVYDYIVDAIDTVSGKLALAETAQACGIPVISAMGAGNKLDPTAFRVADISETTVCPLARIMRRECRKRGITRLKVVYSTEPPRRPVKGPFPDPVPDADASSVEPRPSGRRDIPGSTAFVPSVAGLIIAGEVIRDLCGIPAAR